MFLLTACLTRSDKIADLAAYDKIVKPKFEGPVLTFTKRFSGNGKASGLNVKQTADGGYILTGMIWNEDDYNSDLYVVKTDKSGGMLWEMAFGGAQADEGYSVVEADDGGYALFGSTKSKGAGDSDMYLIKIDANGNKLWEKTYGGPGKESGRSIDKTDDGGYILFGFTRSFGAGGADMYAVKVDADGNETDSKTFGTHGDDWGRSVIQASDGNYMLLGNTPGTHYDMLLIKTDCCGKELWRKTYGGLGKEKGQEIKETADGGYVMIGTITQYGRRDDDIYIVKINKDGREEWSEIIGGKNRDWGYSVYETADGGFVIGGSSKSYSDGDSDMYLLKVIRDGDTLYKVWERTFGGDKGDTGWSVEETTDGGYVFLGWTTSFGNERGEMYLIKVNADGDL